MNRSFSIISTVLCLALAGCGGTAVASKTLSASLGAKSIGQIQPPALISGPLDGRSTRRDLALRRPLAIMVENYSPDSRPQSGLSSASTVIETLAEGGVTRFMALYLEKDAPKVGPVRSTRMYFDRWASSFHAILAHVGGNDDAQNLLWHLPKVFNVDENRWEVNLSNTGTPLFWRSADRVAPHNMYVSTFKLRKYAIRNNQNWAYTQAYLVHKRPAPTKDRGRAGSIDIAFSDPLNPHPVRAYEVHYTFNRGTDTYRRSMGGLPHIDAANGRRIAPANVIIIRTKPASPDPAAGATPDSINIPTLGRGQAIFFRDGKVLHGTWSQPNRDAPLRLRDRRGREVSFNPGQTWIEVVPPTSPVTWFSR